MVPRRPGSSRVLGDERTPCARGGEASRRSVPGVREPSACGGRSPPARPRHVHRQGSCAGPCQTRRPAGETTGIIQRKNTPGPGHRFSAPGHAGPGFRKRPRSRDPCIPGSRRIRRSLRPTQMQSCPEPARKPKKRDQLRVLCGKSDHSLSRLPVEMLLAGQSLFTGRMDNPVLVLGRGVDRVEVEIFCR